MIIVSDTSPIANLIVVSSADLLPQLFGRIVIPNAVYQELLANGVHHPVTQIVETVDWLDVQSVQDLSLVTTLQREQKLDPGEAHAIVLALELKTTQLLMDERLGRTVAKQQGLRITGVLGILLAAKSKGLIPIVRPILDRLINEANFRVRQQLYDEILTLAAE